MAERDLRTNFTADTTDLERGAAKAGRTVESSGSKFSGFAQKAKSYAKVAGVALGAVALKWAGDGMKLASDTAENQSKVQAVFGSSAKSIEAFAKGSAKHLGISKNSALEAAGGFGNMFDQLGIGAKPAADMSTKMLTLAADLGSFNNADPTEVIETMGAAFRGEYDSVQKFIPTISAARVEQEALAQTHKKSAKELTQSEKAMATYSVMVKDAGKANGDFAKTSGGVANQQRIAKAQAEDLQATVGAKLLPVQTALLGVLNQLIPVFATLADFLAKNASWIAPIAIAIGTVVLAIKAWTMAQAALNVVMSANPIVLIIIGIVALVAALVIAYQKVGWFRTGVDAAMKGVKAAFEFVFNFVRQYWPLLLSILAGPIGLAATLIIKNWDKVKAAAQTVFAVVSSVFRTAGSVIAAVTRAAIATWNGLVSALRSGASIVAGIMARVAGAFRGPLAVAQSIVAGIRRVFEELVSYLSGLAHRVGGIVSGIVSAIKAPINAVIGGINAIGFTVPKLEIGGGSFLGKKIPSFTIPGTGRHYDPIPYIPSLAGGGIIPGSRTGTLVRAGENYSSEVIGPLSKVGAMGSTVNNYTITVQVAPGSDPVRAGAGVVDAIRAYERVNGQGWRTAPP